MAKSLIQKLRDRGMSDDEIRESLADGMWEHSAGLLMAFEDGTADPTGDRPQLKPEKEE
jgi:hypothetical protein